MMQTPLPTGSDTSQARAWLALTVGMMVVILAPELAHHGFYYADDVRHYFMPQVMDIGKRLTNGEMPWMTIRSWFGGDYVGEGVLSLFNPINVGLYWLCARVGDASLAALVFAGSYLYLTALGVFALARAYQTNRRWAVIAALAYCSSSFLMYWYASTWWNALVGICWMIWSWAAWRSFIRERRLGLLAFVSTYFLLISGWPHGVIVGAAIVLIELYFARSRFIRPESDQLQVKQMSLLPAIRTWRLSSVFLLAMCAAGASLLSNYPALLHAAESARSSWGVEGGSNWVGSLDYILAAGWPSYTGSASVFFSQKPSFPSFYLSWFAPPALLLLLKRGNRNFELDDVKVLLIIAAATTLLSLGPAQLFVLRWPLRFLTFAHVALAIAACLALSRLNLQDRANKPLWYGYAIGGALLSALVDPENWLMHFSFGGVAVMALLFTASSAAESHTRPLIVGVYLLLIHVLIHVVWPANQNVGNWPVPEQAYVADPEQMEGNSRVVLMRSEYPCDDGGRCPLAGGNIGLWESGRTLNGYSPTGAKSFHSVFGFNIWSWTEPLKPESWALSAYFAKDPATGLSRQELMRIDEFRTAGPVLQSRFSEASRGTWHSEPIHHGMRFRSPGDTPLPPGTISWVSPGLRLAEHVESSSLHERITVVENSSAATDGRIVFARAWYPGYEAFLDGMPLVVQRHWDFLVAVAVPAGKSGTITLRYLPAGLRWTAPLAGMCVLLAIAIVLSNRQRGMFEA